MNNKTYPNYTNEEWEKIIEFYKKNDISFKGISEKYNQPMSKVSKKLKGIKTPPKQKSYTKEEWEEIKKDYIDNNLSIKKIHQKYGMKRTELLKMVKGIKEVKRGDKFNSLEFVEYTDKLKKNYKVGIFKCNCGNITEESVTKVRNGYVKTCGCGRQRNVKTGDKFNKLTVIEEILPEDRKYYIKDERRRMFKFKCDCGNEHITALELVLMDKTKSCGCWRSRSNNASRDKTPEYITYSAMKTRCLNPKATGYENYGGRGITICDEWLGENGFINFLRDMGKRPEGTSIDRIDVDGNYEPSNCRWATNEEQNKNQRPRKKRSK